MINKLKNARKEYSGLEKQISEKISIEAVCKRYDIEPEVFKWYLNQIEKKEEKKKLLKK